jgi:hypothetical protein
MKGGFSKVMSCSRVGYQITLRNPFDYDFVAATSDVLEMTVEEFLMPESVQKIGNVQVITYDERAGLVRPIDMLEFKDLETVSGSITKLADVVSENNFTSSNDQTYIFHYKLQHAVPIGGYFRIMMSEDLINGASISNKVMVAQNCFRVDEANPILQRGLECSVGYVAPPDGTSFLAML